MKKIDSIITTTYQTDVDGFYIDIVEHKTGGLQYDIWLYRKNICHKEYVFGVLRQYNYTISQVLCMAENYLHVDTNLDGLNWFDEYYEQYN